MSEDLKASSPVGSRVNLIAVVILVATCAVLLVVNQQLRSQNLHLIDQYHALSARGGPPVGSKIPALHGTTVSGEPLTLALAQRDRGALLLILSPSCPHCKANLRNWQALMPMVSPKNVFLIDVSDTADQIYLNSIAMPADTSLMRLNLPERSLYSVTLTPMTIWMGPHGVVKQVWTGELQDDQIKQIQSTLLGAQA